MTYYKGSSGTSMNGIDESPERKKRLQKGLKRQEEKWAKKSGPVITRFATGEEKEKMAKKRAAHSVYWLTLARFTSDCDICLKRIMMNSEYVYRHTPRAIVCKTCAETNGIDFTVSETLQPA